MDLLSNTNIDFPFERCLDIGCGYAIQPRIMKALGLAREVVGVDILDRGTSVDERSLGRRHRQLRWLKILESIQKRIQRVPAASRSDLQRALLEKIPSPRYSFKVGTGWMPDTDIYRLRVVNKPTLDRYIVGNVFELQEKLDLITSFSSLEWFEARSIFRKISDLLVVGGVFYLWVPNWWCAVNTTLLAGHFPYACQRLTKEDYFRYLDECLPRYAEAMKIAYNYFDPGHPTLSDYLDIGYDNGLIALDYKSNIFPEPYNMKKGITSAGYFDLDHVELRNVLEDIHNFRPDVRLTDLLANTHAIVFRKVNKSNKIDNTKLENIYKEIDFHYRPTNPIMRALKKLAERYLLKSRKW